MTAATFQLIWEEIKSNIESVKVVALYLGGEPFLNKDFGGMVRRIKSLGVPLVKTVSNGMLLTGVLMEEIIDNGLDIIDFSLDGQSPEENNFLRRNSNFSTVVANIKRLIEVKREKGGNPRNLYCKYPIS